MPLRFGDEGHVDWSIRKIVVVGPGIVGMPMAAMLARARVVEGWDRPAPVVVVQRPSTTSGWKVAAINAGRSPIGGVEPGLDTIVADAVAAGALCATDDFGTVADADVVLVCVQTDKRGTGPDYGPLMEALEPIAEALARRPAGQVPLVVFESTLAPSTMATVICPYFSRHGLEDGRDVLLGNSPNRVMPGRLVERVAASDKVVAGLRPVTPRLVARLYARVVTSGTLHRANSLTAEIVKTLENAYRDVRIAYSAEIARYCDDHDLDFYAVRDEVNRRLAQDDAASHDAGAVPSGGLLVPTVGVGGHCLPKDGILLWWRAVEAGRDAGASLILAARAVNDASPAATLRLAERRIGALDGEPVAVMGAAYRFDSEDTRNSPALALARLLLDRGCRLAIHDPFVRPGDQNLVRLGLDALFTRDAAAALAHARLAVFCTAHGVYAAGLAGLLDAAPSLKAVVDGCNLFREADVAARGLAYCGIGRGKIGPPPGFVEFVLDGFRAVERGVANELESLVEFLNDRYAPDEFNRVDLDAVRRIAATCVTGCRVVEPGPVGRAPEWNGFSPSLAVVAARG